MGPADIQKLISHRVREGQTLEFKADLSTRKQNVDPWYEGKKLSSKARDQILEEAAAFANADGGVLLLGVSEDGDGHAQSICPVPRCQELAIRLSEIFDACIERKLPHVEIFGIPTANEDGVVVIRIGKSNLVPHRVQSTREFPVRRSDRCVHASVQEIRDMMLRTAEGHQRLDGVLSERAAHFSLAFNRLRTPNGAFGLRFTAVPVSEEIRIDRMWRHGRLLDELAPARCSVRRCALSTDADNGSYLQGVADFYQISSWQWKPRLDAAYAEDTFQRYPDKAGLDLATYRELQSDGLIELALLAVNTVQDDRPHMLHFELPIVELAQLTTWADQVRRHTSHPSAEYVTEVEIAARGSCVVANTAFLGARPIGTLPTGAQKFPKQVLWNSESVPQLIAEFERRFWNYFGQDLGERQGILTIEPAN